MNKHSKPIIKYAINQLGKSVFINDVPNGISCDCTCEGCKKELIAIQGKSENHREWHFRHSVDSDCLGGQETAIHKFAKQIIIENTQIEVPGERLNYANARQEIKLDSFIPDVVVEVNQSPVYFEIEVTNPVNLEKINFYKVGQYKSIKIDLSRISRDITPQILKELILNKVDNKEKIFWELDEIKPSVIVFTEDTNVGLFESVKSFCVKNPIFSLIILLLTFLGLQNFFSSRNNR
jgi:hypothetical protein